MPYRSLGTHRARSSLLDFSIFDIGGGLDLKRAPQEVADNKLTLGTNVYLRTDGGLDWRKGVAKRNGATGLAAPTLGLVRFYQSVVAGAAQVPTVRFTLKQVGGNLVNDDTGANYGSIGGAAALPWSVTQVYDGARNGGTDVLVICTGAGGPYFFDGTTLYTPAAFAGTVAGARWCQAFGNGIVWFAGIPGQPSLVWGTAIGNPESAPFYQEINVSNRVNGLGRVGQGAQGALVVGMNRGLAIISGVGPGTFIVQEMPMNDGVMAGNSMISVDGVLYFIGETAIYRYDGWSITPISDDVEPIILNAPENNYFPMDGDRSYSWALYYNRRIYFFYDSGSVGHTNTALVYDLNRRGWTIYNGLAFSCGALLLAPEDPDPNLAVVGSAVNGQVYNFEVYVNTGPPSIFQSVSDDGAAIFYQAQTKFFKLGDPGTPKTLMRCYPEIFTTSANLTFSAVTDYGLESDLAVIPTSNKAGSTWGTSTWLGTDWASPQLTFSKPRLDFNLQGEAFAFMMMSRDTNPPARWVGLSGTFAQEGRA